MTDPYGPVIEALSQHAIDAERQNENHLVISTQVGPIWPGRGNSFWISCINGEWYICSWVPVCHRLPPDADIVSLCVECMNASGKAMYRVPEGLVRKYNLQELNEEEVDKFFSWYG